jgi:hypothetical protein
MPAFPAFPAPSALRRALAAGTALLAAGCVTPVPDPVYAPCKILGTSGWTARVERFASAHPKPVYTRHLIVSGEVTVPEGVSVSLHRGPVARLEPPIQQIMIRTEGSGEAGAAPVTRRVQGTFPALKRYGGVEMRCGDGVVAEIADVPLPPPRKG